MNKTSLLRNKRGQAAIEFLMTYGWMLLVVLIVGALIFSFVDFGALLPNKLDLSGNLRGMAAESQATSTDDTVKVVFSYVGANRGTIEGNAGTIELSTGETCSMTTVENKDTSSGAVPADVNFLNGQLGIATFDCTAEGLIEGDVVEGKVTIPVENPKTDLTIDSTGPIRLTIQ
ncbi:MAG: hypothetical protein ACOCXG_03505 [Nanoarchaeota archaeon]